LTAVHDIAQAWTGIGAAVYTLWQQSKVASSTWTMTGVVFYLACVSTLHIASTTIMQFTAFNSSSIITVQSAVAFPDNIGGLWEATFQSIPPGSLLSNIQTTGLLNNTLYDILPTTDPNFINATVNATSLQANCRLLSNLTFSDSGPSPTLNFSVNNFGSGGFVLYGDGEFVKLSIKYFALFMALHNLESILSGRIARNQIDLILFYSTNVIPIFSSVIVSPEKLTAFLLGS
jgi:hypothetical protein